MATRRNTFILIIFFMCDYSNGACPSLFSTESTIVKCSLHNISLPNCLNPAEQTIAELSCTPFYEEVSLARNPIRICRNGQWNPSIVKCYQACGLTFPKEAPNIINGEIAVIHGDYPWHVGVYANMYLICSGSIVYPNIIISSASCFANHYKTINRNQDYFIAAGKYYSEYNDPRDNYAQYSEVKEIHVPKGFKELYEFYSNDIAVIILKDPFVYSEVVQPICVNLDEAHQSVNFSIFDTAVVTGWSREIEDEYPSDALKVMMVFHIPNYECYTEVISTNDKICSIYYHGGMFCHNTGGGLSVQNEVNGRYYLVGSLSTFPILRTFGCHFNRHKVFTKMSAYIKFVKEYVEYYKSEQPVESVGETDHKIGCRFPNFPLDGKYILLPQNDTLAPGDYVPLRSILSLSCDIGYEVVPSGTTQFFCVNQEEWFPTLGTCNRMLYRVFILKLPAINISKTKSQMTKCFDQKLYDSEGDRI